MPRAKATQQRIRQSSGGDKVFLLQTAPQIGPLLLVATWTGAALGYPLFLWLDPLALLAAWVNAWRTPIAWMTVAGGLGLPALFIVEILWPGLWCARIRNSGSGGVCPAARRLTR
ncbi:MAG TPA: hypothetical protein PKM43_03410 [Verrucomicrobiota bacterium]|nr:hypothetical protein [Verrucomicrobiota bacterium]HRZ35180.1 hypothetical protein [Candidatus Paceibacterota bacterium]HRZ55584.1 hypothetical protein [Candidatus Paceibacterota bacterium]